MELTIIVKIEEENLHLLKNLINVNEIFRKNITYYNIIQNEKAGLHPFSGKYILVRAIGWFKPTHPPAFLRLKEAFLKIHKPPLQLLFVKLPTSSEQQR